MSFHTTGIPTTSKPTITNINQMATHVLDGTGTGGFGFSDALDYGCAGRGLFDPKSATAGKQVDEVDKHFYAWKKCTQCALLSVNFNLDEVSYNYDVGSCGKKLNLLNASITVTIFYPSKLR